MTTRPASRAALAGGLVALLFSTCRLDSEEFHKKLYTCNPSAADPACGTDGSNTPMACVAAHQLGGRNFCATGCDQKTAPTEGDAAGICLASGPKNAGVLSGAQLRKCDPTALNPCGDEQLTCLRTDLIENEGVCMTINPCKTNADCRDPVRSLCMGELIRNVYGDKAGLASDHTYCLQGGCRANRTSCSPGETCLRDIIAPESRPSDICVPNCDSNKNCPPNYFCYSENYGPKAANICIPGLLGLRCRSRLDCLFGDCIPTRVGFNVCSVRCNGQEDCAKYDSEYGAFFCNPGGFCMSGRAFTNTSSCDEAIKDCLPDQVCAILPSRPSAGKLCFFPCAKDGSVACPAYGGVPHACHPLLGFCLPGQLGIPCTANEQCFPSLDCRNVGPISRCTILCKADEDCRKNRFATEGWCEITLGVCLPPLNEGEKCVRPAQCESKSCATTTMTCARLAGY